VFCEDGLRLLRGRERREPEASGVSGESIPDDDRVDEAGEGGEELLEIRISDLVSQAQDDQLPSACIVICVH